MKTWGFGVKALAFAGVTVLIPGLWLLTSFRGAEKVNGKTAGVRVTPAAVGGTSNSALTKQDLRWADTYGRLPMSFEANVGQTAQEVRYMSHGTGYALFLTSQEAVVSLQHSMAYNLSPLHRTEYFRALRKAHQVERTTVVRMGLEGANPAAQIAGVDQQPGQVNYFIGNNPKNWRTNVPSYARVKYEGIYPGVDLVFYGNQRRLEYDFVVAPGADPKIIQLSLKGAQKLRINSNGDLVLSVSGGQVALQKPVMYQNVSGERHEIEGRYVLASGHKVTFAVAKYDRSEALIIDPVLNYSTYLGGSASGDVGSGIAVDSLGDAFVTGTTFSTTFPDAPGGFGAGNANGVAFVTEINPTGTALLYTTYLGGTGGDFGFGIALDNSGNGANPGGNVYVTGGTFSTDFPTTAANALKPASAGASAGTSFISKINPTANGLASLVYSSYLGGTDGLAGTIPDFGNSVAADTAGNAYVTGLTTSSPGSADANFPITAASAFQTALGTTAGNAFLSRIDTTKVGAASLAYSTYLGGSGANAASQGFGEEARGVAVDASENAYMVGITTSTDFPMTSPVPNGYQTTAPAAVANGTIFVSRIDTSTTKAPAASLIYSTYLGGQTEDLGAGIALKPNSAVAYVTGVTLSSQFPTFPGVAPGPYQTTGGGAGGTGFVSLIDTGQSGANSLTYSTFVGPGSTEAFCIAVDVTGNAYIGGGTGGSTYPLTPGAFQTAFATGAAGEGFISEINPGGNGAADLVYSSLFGGSGSAVTGPDFVSGIAVDSQNNAYITGTTSSSAATFPVFPVGAFQTTLPAGDASAAFIAKLTLIPTLVVSPTSLNFGTVSMPSTSPAQTVTLTNNTNATIAFTSATFTNGTPAAATTDYAVSANTCAAGIPAGAAPANQCTVSVTFKPSVVGAETATLLLTDGDSTSPQSVSLTGTGAAAGAPGVTLAPSPLPFGGEMLTTTSGAKTVTLTNTGTGALTINSIAASGDYAETSTGATACPIAPATLAAGANCTINVTFAPTALNARAGNLTVTDNAAGSPHVVPLTGTGWDFSLAGPAQAPPAITTAAPGKFNITMTPLGGFNQAVALTCGVTPAAADATCTVASPVMAADGVTVQSAAVTVTTTAMMVPPGSVPTPPVSIRQVVPLILALLLLLLLPRTKRLQVRLGMAGAMLLLVILAGCSGPGKPPAQPIPAVLTITGTTSGTPPGVVTHTATVNLTIN